MWQKRHRVLVHYWGVGTMQHQFGEPGLWLQAIVQGGERRLEIGTGPEFLTASCAALDSRSPRICVQQAFTEHLDMSRWEDFSAPGLPPRSRPLDARRPHPPGHGPCCLPGISRL